MLIGGVGTPRQPRKRVLWVELDVQVQMDDTNCPRSHAVPANLLLGPAPPLTMELNLRFNGR